MEKIRLSTLSKTVHEIPVKQMCLNILIAHPNDMFSSKELSRLIGRGYSPNYVNSVLHPLVREGVIVKVPMKWGNCGKLGYKIGNLDNYPS